MLAGLRELGGPEFLAELGELFIEDVPPQLEALREPIEGSDTSSVERIAHTLKGSCGNMGALGMSTLCAELQDMGHSGELEYAPMLLERLKAEFGRVRQALEAEAFRDTVGMPVRYEEKDPVMLSETEREELKRLIAAGTAPARKLSPRCIPGAPTASPFASRNGRSQDDPDPRAISCYGLYLPEFEETWLRFVDDRPVSGITTRFLSWCSEKLASLGKRALVLVWDNASWHVSKEVRRWIGEHNRSVKKGHKECVRIISCLLPKQSPWLNPIEPKKWVHGKRCVAEADGLIGANELAERVCAAFGCPHHEHLSLPEKVA